MRNRNIAKVLALLSMLTTSIVIIGCGSKIENSEERAKINIIEQTEKNTEKEESTEDSFEIIDTTVSSGYCLSLGVLDKNFAINGSNRNEEELAILNDKVLFPQCAIRSISIGGWSRKNQAYRLEQSEVDVLVNEVENAKIIKNLPDSAFKNTTRFKTNILILNSHGEFRTVCVTSYGKGYHEVTFEKDDKDNFSKNISIVSEQGVKKKHIFLQSNKLENMIKKWILFEKEDKDFSSIKEAIMTTEDGKVRKKLSKEEINLLKKCVVNKQKTVNNPCGHDCYFECVLDDGSNFHFSLCADGESMSTDKNVFVIDKSQIAKLAVLLKR